MYFVVHMRHVFIRVSVDEHLSRFYILAIVNNVAVNTSLLSLVCNLWILLHFYISLYKTYLIVPKS